MFSPPVTGRFIINTTLRGSHAYIPGTTGSLRPYHATFCRAFTPLIKQFVAFFWPILKPPCGPVWSLFAHSLTDLEIAHYGVFTLTNFVTATVDWLTDHGRRSTTWSASRKTAAWMHAGILFSPKDRTNAWHLDRRELAGFIGVPLLWEA